MVGSAFDDAWTEFCLVGIQEFGGSEVQYASITEDITAMDWGEKDIEGMPMVSGGRVVKRTPMTDESLTFKGYPISANTDGTGLVPLIHPTGDTAGSADTTDPIRVVNSNDRRKYQVVLLWSQQLPNGTVTTASGTSQGANDAAYRITARNAYMTSYKPSFDDKIMSAEFTFKWAPFDKNGSANKYEESTVGTVKLPNVTSFA